jgi:Undecaprenyl-phosphate glucose phosphotransferase
MSDTQVIDRLSPGLDSIANNARRWHLPSLSAEVVTGLVKAVDFCLVVAAAVPAFVFYFGLFAATAGAGDARRYGLAALVAAILFVAGFERLGGYEIKRLAQLRWQLPRVAMTWGATISVLLFVSFVGKLTADYSRGWAIAWMVIGLATLLGGRGLVSLAMTPGVRQRFLTRRIAIIGSGESCDELIAELQRSEHESFVIHGIFDDRGAPRAVPVRGVKLLGNTDELLDFVREVQVDEVILAFPPTAGKRLRMLFDKLTQVAVDVRLVAAPFSDEFPIKGISHLGNSSLFHIIDRPLKNWNAFTKFLEDRVLGTLFILLLAPLMAVIALLIKLDSKGPVLFIQERFGYNSRVIRVIKFRTMHVDRCDITGAQRTIRNDPRITRIGRILRALSLDEIPQLFNVLKGEMSLVGPRPHAITMKAGDRLYHEAIDRYLNRHRVKPGLTGWAQINGFRGEVDTIEKARGRLAHDLHYIKSWSIWFDLKILALTLPKMLLTRDQAY